MIGPDITIVLIRWNHQGKADKQEKYILKVLEYYFNEYLDTKIDRPNVKRISESINEYSEFFSVKISKTSMLRYRYFFSTLFSFPPNFDFEKAARFLNCQ